MTPTPKPGILDIAPYVGGRAGIPGVARVHKLSSNESPVGPSPKAVAALTAAAHDLQLYPDGGSRLLREAIAAVHGLEAARIVVGGEGSGPLLTMLANAYLRPGDEAIFSAHAFLIYEIATRANSAAPVIVAEKTSNSGIKIDVDAMLAAVTARTRMVYIANPNNPTGSYLTREEMARLHAGLPADVLLVIDAAYGEFVDAPDYDTGIELAKAHGNVVMTRTFSKIHGLAALRLGWAYVPEAVADVLNRIRGPFPTSPLQQQAGAAAIADQAHVAMAAARNAKWRGWLIGEIRKLGLRVDDSQANFVLIHFADEDTARRADTFLSARGIILRGVGAYGLPGCLRLTVGTGEQNELVVTALRDFPGGMMFDKITLIGLGLIGSSIGHAIKRGDLARTVVGYDASPAVVAKAKEIGFVQVGAASAAEAVADADLVILCVPMGAYQSVSAQIAPHLKRHAILSDVGSVKATALRDVTVPPGVHFIPAHPIAGTEFSGPEAGFASLFDRRWCILTPPPGADADAVAKLKSFWQALGASVDVMEAGHHDLVLAVTSHLPHLIAYNIVGTAHDLETVTEGEVIKYSASGFRDSTRVAASDPTMWRDIFLNNRDAVLNVLARFNSDLKQLQAAVEKGDGEALFNRFTRARAIRRSIIDIGQDSPAANFGRDDRKPQ